MAPRPGFWRLWLLGCRAELRYALLGPGGGQSRCCERRALAVPISTRTSCGRDGRRRPRPVSDAGRQDHRCDVPDRLKTKRSTPLMRQSVETQMHEVEPESVDIPGTQLRVSRVALGTWAMGGWMWGGTDERESVATIRAALEQGINLIDTAPVYGFGVSEEIVGQAVGAAGLRSQAVIATKVGLEWRDGKVYRNATRDRIMREIDDSLRRLRSEEHTSE